MNRKFFGARIFIVNQKFSRRDKIVKDVLLFQFRAGFVPSFAVFRAAAQVGNGINAAHFHPNHPRNRKSGRLRNIETAVTIKQSRVVAVEFDAFFVDDKHRHGCSVFAFVFDLFDFVIIPVDIDFRLAEKFTFARFHIVTVNCWRCVVARIAIKSFCFVTLSAKTSRRTDSRKFYFADKFSFEVVNSELRVSVFQIIQDKLVVDKINALQSFSRFGNEVAPFSQFRQRIGNDNFSAWCFIVG